MFVYNFIQRPRDVKQYNHCSHLLQLIPQLVAKILSSSSRENFSPLEHINIHLQISYLTQIFLPRFFGRACIQPAAAYQCYHVIVNEPIKIIHKPKVIGEGGNGNRPEILPTLMFSEVFYQLIFLAVSNSFSSNEVIPDHQRTAASDWHWRE